ncbi:hypothetical protein [Micromonospora sp. LA-10]
MAEAFQIGARSPADKRRTGEVSPGEETGLKGSEPQGTVDGRQLRTRAPG